MLLYLSEFGTPLEIFSQISTIEEGIDVYSYILYFVGFAVAGAMLSGKGWGRTLIVILTIIEIVLAAVFLFWDGRQVVVLIIGVIILWYLRKPHVKAYFGQSGAKLQKLNLNSKRLGDFSLDKQGNDVYYLQNGIYRFNDSWKNRGLGNLGSKEIEQLETYVKGDRLYRKFTINRVKQLRSSIIQNEISEIGKIKPIVREVDLNADNKRFWLGSLSKIDNYTNNSVPLSANHFQI